MTSVRKIPLDDMRRLVYSYHYLGPVKFRASFCYGIFEDETLLGGIAYHSVSALETIIGAFGLPRSEHKGFWEIGRLVLDPLVNGMNFGSSLISRSVKLLQKDTSVRAIITYAEHPRHTGAVYNASNFSYHGLTTRKKDFYVNGVKKERGKTKGVIGGEWRTRPRKHRFLRIIDKSLHVKWPNVNPKNRAALDLIC